MIYTFDCKDKGEERFNKILDCFRSDYLRLYNEPQLPCKNMLFIPLQ